MVTLQVLYLMMCFSDFVLDPEIRSFCGLAFITVVCLYAAVHIFFLLTNVYAQLKYLILKKYYSRRNKKILNQLRQNMLKGNHQIPVKASKDTTNRVKISDKGDKSYGQDVQKELDLIAEVSDYKLEIS